MSKSFRLLIVLLLALAAPAFAQSAPSPDEALKMLMEGNRRFVEGKRLHPHQDEQRRMEVAAGQKPFAVILGCADSRVPPDLLFDQGLADLFVVRVAGNTLDDILLGSIEYSASVLGSPLVMVLGHEKCGAVEAALKPGPLPGHIEAIGKVIRADLQGNTCDPKGTSTCAVKWNVESVVKQLRSSQPILEPLIQAGKLKVVGAFYDLKSGRVEMLEP